MSLRKLMVFACLALLIAAGPMSLPAVAEQRDLGHEILAPNDGWASEGPGVTGGSAAAPDHIYTVTDRAGLIAALNDGVVSTPVPAIANNDPKIIYVSGTIDANVDDNNQPLTCQDYQRNGYTLEAYLAAYDPAVWGRTTVPSGPLETARVASQKAQEARVRLRVGSNTTVVGLGPNATVRGAWFDIRATGGISPTNIIIRNITFQDTYDCFPQWDPTDGSLGNWNSQYDSIALRQADHVWIDHNRFEDVATIDSGEPTYFGRHFERHDGLTDITNASNYVTVSWNEYRDHDKVMLIGSSDSGNTAKGDRTRLKVTIHHNLFLDLGQRTPRVRFGQVHVYNNYYNIDHSPYYGYSWGVGIESAIYAQNNYFKAGDITPDRFIGVYKGTKIFEEGTYVDGRSVNRMVDVVAAFNAAKDPDLSPGVGWTPTRYTAIDPTRAVTGLVMSGAGPFNW